MTRQYINAVYVQPCKLPQLLNSDDFLAKKNTNEPKNQDFIIFH